MLPGGNLSLPRSLAPGAAPGATVERILLLSESLADAMEVSPYVRWARYSQAVKELKAGRWVSADTILGQDSRSDEDYRAFRYQSGIIGGTWG